MTFAIFVGGSRGDIDPYLALGAALAGRGHRVRLCGAPAHGQAAARAGLGFAALGADPARADGPETLARAHGSLAGLLGGIRRQTVPAMPARFAHARRACTDADVLVASPLTVPLAVSIGEALDRPVVRAFYSPASPTAAYPSIVLPQSWRLPGPVNRWSHHLTSRVALLPFRRSLNQARRDVLGLGPIAADPLRALDAQQVPVLYGYSPLVCPPPADFGSHVHVTGYWRPPHLDWTPPAALLRFLDAGPPPVYVGFGSMVAPDPRALTTVVVATLAQMGLRGVLGRGWGGLTPVDAPHVHVVDDVPHAWLFPRVRAAVHHGGAGTTGASLTAGLATVTIPFGMPDQSFWGTQVSRLGVGPRPVPRRHLTTERLQDALRAALDGPVQARARRLGEAIRREDGLATAVGVLERWLTSRTAAGLRR